MNDYNEGDMVVMNMDLLPFCRANDEVTYVKPSIARKCSILKNIYGDDISVPNHSFDLLDKTKIDSSLLIDNMEMGDLYTVIKPVYEFEQGFFEYVESDSPGDGKAFFIKVRGGEHYLFDLSSMEPANLTVNIDGLECELDQGEYEEVMEIIKRHKGKR
tara:strand:+ start:1141 stop:1617 length:477 start_codon:yes stop_codon:yes gene_type:complete